MSAIPQRLKTLLEQRAVPYEIVQHRRDYTAQETAVDTQTPGEAFAKTVIVWVDGTFAMAVLPADHRVVVPKLRQALGAQQVALASEDELRVLFPDCEVGAMPPFGNLYHLPIYVSTALRTQDRITFPAGTHDTAIRMHYSDFVKLVQPRVIDFSQPM